MKPKGTLLRCAQKMLCWLLLAGLLVAPAVTAAESQRLMVEQRYAVVPPPAQAKTFAEAPQATPAAKQAAVKALPAQVAEDAAPARSAVPTQAPAEQKSGNEPLFTLVQQQPATQSDQEPALDYAGAVRQAVTSAQQFKTTQLDIEVSKLGEKDAWYRLFPKLILIASYDKPLSDYASGSKAQPYTNLSFSTGAYDPISAYIGHDASTVAVKLAELVHVYAIQTQMEKIGMAYITLHAKEQLIACRQELNDLAQKLEDFTAERVQKGSVAPLDLRLAEMKHSVAKLELEHESSQRKQEIIRLKRLLGIEAGRKVDFDTKKSLPQVIGEQPTYTLPDFSQVERRNLSFKIMKLQEKLQTFNVRLAKADHLPKFSFGLRTPDPTATRDSASPYYLNFSASMPLWSWGETLRNTERSELTGQKLAAANALQIEMARDTWSTSEMELRLLRERLTIATATRELRELEAKRKAIGQQVGNVSYETLLEFQAAAINAKLLEINAQETYAMSRLRTRVQSGDLLNQYIRVGNGNLE